MVATRELVGGVTVFRLHVSLDFVGVGAFRREVVSQIGDGSRVVLDLSEVAHLDQSGCLALLDCSRRADPGGNGQGEVKLCGLSNGVRSVLELLRVDELVDTFATRSEAVRAFADA